MNYSVKTKELYDYISMHPGVVAADLKHDPKLIRRLVKNGVLTTAPGPVRGRGRPSVRLYAGMAPPQAAKESLYVKVGKYRPNHDAIVEFLRERGEASLGQIAVHLKKEQHNVSGTLLRMASCGKVVRRRMLGKISGRAQSCEWYSYRLPEV